MKFAITLINMQSAQIKSLSLSDVDDLVEHFVSTNNDSIHKHWISKNESSKLGYEAFVAELKPQLKNSCVTFLNSNLEFSVLNAYLFSTVITASKKEISQNIKRIAMPVCPGCKFLGFEQVLSSKKVYRCSRCEEQLQQPLSVQHKKLASIFAIHNNNGYKCPDCTRFIPHPRDTSRDITCPYFNCAFFGSIGELIKMRHPTVMQKVRISSLDVCIKDTNVTSKDALVSGDISTQSGLEIKENIDSNLLLLRETIDSQVNSLYYTSSEATRTQHLAMYEAFKNMVDTHPEEMISYLCYLNRGEGLQHKIFQEFISILEKNLPFGFKKNGKMFKISSLLDEKLSLFDGISNFSGVVSDKRDIKNQTEEYYIGGRSGAYSKPYYIGKLLEVINKSTGTSILSDVKEYSFSKIKFKTTSPGTQVMVTHLRVPPHYQMGGMVYLNRIRRKIVDKIYLTQHGQKRTPNQ